MSVVNIIFAKELKSYLTSSMTYIATGMFSFVLGLLFFHSLMLSNETYQSEITLEVMRPIFGNMNFLMIFICPLITMKQFSEEKKMGTLNLLFSCPISHWQILLGKFFASYAVSLAIVSVSLIFPLILAMAGYSNWPVVFSSYTGLALNIFCFVSVGVFASSLTQNQFLAVIITFAILFSSLILMISASAIKDPLFSGFLEYFSIAFHYEGFSRGVIKNYNIFYFLGSGLIFHYLTVKSLDSRNW
jgi:ABC-2 type transport system permease protein